MTITHWEKVAVFLTTKVRDCNPIILILLVWIWRSHSGLGGKCEFCDSVGRHLLGVPMDKSKLLFLDTVLNRCDWISLGLILLNTVILAFRYITTKFLDWFLGKLGSDISRLRWIHLDLMTAWVTFLNKILYLCRQRVVSINHISIRLRSLVWLLRCDNPLFLPICGTHNGLLLLCIVLLMTEWSLMNGCNWHLLFGFIGCILALLLLRGTWLLDAVSTCYLVILCPGLIVRDLPRHDGHEILNVVREHVLDVRRLLLVLTQNVLQHIFLC